ncbi:helix-turn-helix transcriptional regulator [Hyphococcus flavus]|uniref:Helix-turn-helix transcriptional regulator n=1 Tax=Hyphococcus flavus TaxID=1866326 RepID=A0AAF0CDT2_9PROT|nr:helix-turn-helix transcriptional regulator [Hyphococcus flavus]WDI30206.1 helix-turn-helix transcriptional regulator [Hyphococcus flavus]
MAMLRDFHADAQVSTHKDVAEDPLHRHRSAYAAIVTDGAYLELSADGVFAVEAGDIVIHPPFHRHRNIFTRPDTCVLNVPLPFCEAQRIGYKVLKPEEFDVLRSVALKTPDYAPAFILQHANGVERYANNAGGCAVKAADLLRCHAEITIAEICRNLNISHGHLARAFKRFFGASPAEFRGELRFRRALSSILSQAALTDAAHVSGYADQAHMTRDFKRRTGVSPGALRRDVRFVQASTG